MTEVEKVIAGNDCYYYKKGTGILHREDGPAVELGLHYRAWYIDGMLHCEGGPAVRIRNARASVDKWYLNGESLSQEDFIKRVGSKNGN